MKTKFFILLLAIGLMVPAATNAQFGALKKAINKQLNKADSSKNKDEAQNNSSDRQGGTKETGRGMFGGKIDIKYNDEYNFTGRIYMQMELYDKKEVTKSDYYTYFNANTMNAAIDFTPSDGKEGGRNVPATFIFDNDNRCFMMLMKSDDKTGVISTLPSDSAMKEMAKNQQGPDPSKATITKTGNSRMIAGYKCDEYKVVDADKEGYSNVWMTKDVKIKADKKYWGRAGVPTYYNYPGFEGAMMLAMESFDKKNEPTMKLETKDINENFKNSISTVGYTFMKMKFGQAGK